MRDLYNNIEARQAISPVIPTNNTAIVSSIIDMLGYDSLTWLIALGTLADADATFAVTMDEGNASNLSDAAAVAAGDLLGSYAAASYTFANDDTVRKIGYKGTKRYVRLTITPSNNTGNHPVSAVAVLGNAMKAPTP